MSLARAMSRGARLNARFGVNGSQKDSRSLGWRAAAAPTSLVIRFIAASARRGGRQKSQSILPESGGGVAAVFLPRQRGGARASMNFGDESEASRLAPFHHPALAARAPDGPPPPRCARGRINKCVLATRFLRPSLANAIPKFFAST